MSTDTITINDAKVALALEIEAEHNVNSYDDNTIVIKLSDDFMTLLRDVHDNDAKGDSRVFDAHCTRLLCAGIIARARSIYSAQDTQNAKLLAAKLRLCKGADSANALMDEAREIERVSAERKSRLQTLSASL